MRFRRQPAAAVIAASAAIAFAAPSGNAAPFLPVGSGVWGPSTNVTGACGSGIWVGNTPCDVRASSRYTPPGTTLIVESCANASYVVTTPVVIGTNFGCHVEFSATLEATGAGGTVEPGEETTAIEAGSCAGLTVSNAYATVADNAVGSYVVNVKVVVTNVGWKFQGNLIALHVPTATVVVLNVVGTITPGCVRLRDNSVQFTGVFKGSYQFL